VHSIGNELIDPTAKHLRKVAYMPKQNKKLPHIPNIEDRSTVLD